MPRARPVLILAVAALLAPAATATAATVRTAATPDALRAGKATYEKQLAAGYAKATKLLDDQLKKHPKKPTVVLDVDETTLSNWACLDAVDFNLSGLATCVIKSTSKAIPAAKAFVKHARAEQVKIAFVTGAPALVCPARKKNLIAQGIPSAFTITCKPASYTTDSLVPFKSAARKAIIKKGATIVLNVGDQKSDLAGGAAQKAVLLPNPIYTTN
jgi:predicted secreted acid phosphatase